MDHGLWRSAFRVRPSIWRSSAQTRSLLTLAIETSCDDTCVAVLSTSPTTQLLFNKKISANNARFLGINPSVSLHSHHTNLAALIQQAITHLPTSDNPSDPSKTVLYPQADAAVARSKPTFISITRGPGIGSHLSIGLALAKGLATAWDIPLVGVHHMQAHLLTPRLVYALAQAPSSPPPSPSPAFPFLTLLTSGGHTLLLHSHGLNTHNLLAETMDIAVGNLLDKAARLILPLAILAKTSDVMYARAMEAFVFPTGEAGHEYTALRTRAERAEKRVSRWGWALTPPLTGGARVREMVFSFAGLGAQVRGIVEQRAEEGGMVSDEERQELGQEVMRVAFEHLAGRVVLALEKLAAGRADEPTGMPTTLVLSGGVAANAYLRTM
ncbi:MAG: hypothetical protein M1814_004834 [Vezdaea aestivalis]|nr:MAG: hypothetical protein M1814_004834 [Vezdaea aestivalis]